MAGEQERPMYRCSLKIGNNPQYAEEKEVIATDHERGGAGQELVLFVNDKVVAKYASSLGQGFSFERLQ